MEREKERKRERDKETKKERDKEKEIYRKVISKKLWSSA